MEWIIVVAILLVLAACQPAWRSACIVSPPAGRLPVER